VLALIEETEAPFVSCYLNLEQDEAGYRNALESRALAVRESIRGNARVDFDAAMERIAAYLATELRSDAQGVALFARSVLGGGFFLPMQFAAPVPNWIAAGPTPDLFHLVALMDNYHRYVVMMTTDASVRIIEVNLGAATVKASNTQPERNRTNRTRANVHGESRGSARRMRFLKEQIDLLECVMMAGGHMHLILAGDPQSTGEIRRVLPKSVAAKLVDTIPAAAHHAPKDVVAATLSAFVEWEEQESQAIAARILQDFRTVGLAAMGATSCLDAMRQRRVDVLLMARDHLSVPGWHCSACAATRLEPRAPAACPKCGMQAVWPIDATSELLRLAGQRDCPVEVVDYCDPLMAIGGVACLLRC
jgi:protein required for attachment to host cells